MFLSDLIPDYSSLKELYPKIEDRNKFFYWLTNADPAFEKTFSKDHLRDPDFAAFAQRERGKK